MRYILNNVNYKPKGMTNERLEPNPEIVCIKNIKMD